MAQLPNKIKRITKTYHRTDSGKSWKSNPTTTEEEHIDADTYRRSTSEGTQRWFRRLGGYERADYEYTYYGYLPTRLVSIGPNRRVKKVRIYILPDPQD